MCISLRGAARHKNGIWQWSPSRFPLQVPKSGQVENDGGRHWLREIAVNGFPPSPYRRVATLENRNDCSAAEMAGNALPHRLFYQARGDRDDAYGLARAVDAEF